MKTPAFWWQAAPVLAARLLKPVGWAYGSATVWQAARQMPFKASVPVLCVGNFIAGGAGKTPTVIALVALLRAMGQMPFILSRGYGGTWSGPPLRVSLRHHRVQLVGDEPLLLARYAPVIVCKDRVAAAKIAITQGASILVLDDGLQNQSLHKDYTLGVVDAAHGIGNGLCVPAGPLRAPLHQQWKWCDGVILLGNMTEVGTKIAEAATAHGKSMMHAKLVLDDEAFPLQGTRVFAFAGIGVPEKFFESLRAAGANIVGYQAYADHQPYTQKRIDHLRIRAHAHNAHLVTTQKDGMRLHGLEYIENIVQIPAQFLWEGQSQQLMQNVLSALIQK